MSKVVDFDNYKKNNKEQVGSSAFSERIESISEKIMNTMMEQNAYFQQSPLMYESYGLVFGNIGRMLMYLTITDIAFNNIKKASLDPDKFRVDADSIDFFMNNGFSGTMSVEEFNKALEADEDSAIDVLWNGPYYESDSNKIRYRAATTVIMNEEEGPIISVDVLRLKRGHSNWEIFYQGKWMQGPPDDFFDYLTTIRENWTDDDDEDDEYDGDWENDINSLDLPYSILSSLHKAGIFEIDQLKQMSNEDILKIDGIGKKSLKKIREELEDII